MAESGLEVGQMFLSYESLMVKIEEYQEAKSCKFYVRDSRTISAAKGRVKRALSSSLKYYELTLSCIHGGKKFKPRGNGRRATMTFKQGCPVQIKLRATLDGKSLEVKYFESKHNHDVSKELYAHLPHQRQLDDETKDEVKHLLKLKVNKKLLRDHVASKTGKVVTLKDIANLQTAVRGGRSRNDLIAVVEMLQKEPGGTVEIVKDEEDNLRGIFYQDADMKSTFRSFPEVLFVDATYKVNDLRLPLYVFLIEDGNGLSEIIAIWLIADESGTTIESMTDVFTKHNPCSKDIKVVMADKDFNEREIFANAFPQASLLICLFHTLRTFRREVTVEKMVITVGQRTHALEMFQKMAYSKSIDEYDGYYTDFKSSSPRSVVSYYDSNWHPIREQWVMCMKHSSGNFLNDTNNRLESINQKIKSVLTKHASLEEFTKYFLSLLSTLRNERDHIAIKTIHKIPILIFPENSPEYRYRQLLTSFAYNYVLKQIELIGKVKLVQNGDDDECTAETSAGELLVTANSCECSFRRGMCLPCRHIFAYRSAKELDLFETSLCARRWTMEYYKQSQRALASRSSSSSFCHVSTATSDSSRVLSQHEKYRKCHLITTKLASLASESTIGEFNQRYELLLQLMSYWESGKMAYVVEVEDVQEDIEGGVDQMSSGAGVDQMSSGDGVDQMSSGDGVDQMSSGDGVDQMSSGGGVDLKPGDIDGMNHEDGVGSQASSGNDTTDTLLQVLMNGEMVTVEVHEKEKLISVASKLANMGYDIDVIYPTIRDVDGVWISEQETVNPKNYYHFYSAGTSPIDFMSDEELHAYWSNQSRGETDPPESAMANSLSETQPQNLSAALPENPDPTSSSLPADTDFAISRIKIPPKMPKRGRPKGALLTTIGLPSRKKKKRMADGKPVEFVKKPMLDQHRMMVRWFVDDDVAEKAIATSYRILEAEVEVIPENVPAVCTDENINILAIRQYFTIDGWSCVKSVLDVHKENDYWLCNLCKEELHSEGSLGCDSCLQWFHLRCLGKKTCPKTKKWFCRECYSRP